MNINDNEINNLVTSLLANQDSRDLWDKRAQWLLNLYDIDVTRDYRLACKQNNIVQILPQFDEYISNLNDFTLVKWQNPNFLNSLVSLTYELINLNDYEIAIIFLQDLLKVLPDDIFLNYEYGFVLLLTGEYRQSMHYFEKVLNKEKSFDTVLNLIIGNIYLLNMDKLTIYQNLLKELASNPDERTELANVNKIILRLQEYPSLKNIKNYRDWLYILYGNILLVDFKSDKAMFNEYKPNLVEILTHIYILKRFFEALNISLELFEYFDEDSHILAQLFALIFELPVEKVSTEIKNAKNMLIVSNPHKITEVYHNYNKINNNQIIYFYSLPFSSALPIIPAVVNCITDKLNLPFTQISYGTKEYHDLMIKAQDLVNNIETDCNSAIKIQQLIEYYELRQPNLILENQDIFKDYVQYHGELKYLITAN